MKIERHGNVVKLWLSAEDTRRWAGNLWPCSYIAGKTLFVEFDRGDLVDYALDSLRDEALDIDSDEFKAITSYFIKEQFRGNLLRPYRTNTGFKIKKENDMWLMILLSNKWYGTEYADEYCLRRDMDNVFEHVNTGTVVSICDDLDWWCEEMDVDKETVIIVESE